MKMAIVTPFLEHFGGLERVILKIAEHYNADIYCMSYNEENTFDGFRKINIYENKSLISSIPPHRVFSAIDAAKYFYTLRLDGYDIINAHQSPSEWVAKNNDNVLHYCHAPNREVYDLYNWRMSKRNILQKVVFYPDVGNKKKKCVCWFRK